MGGVLILLGVGGWLGFDGFLDEELEAELLLLCVPDGLGGFCGPFGDCF